MSYTPYALPLLMSAGAMALLAMYGWRHRTAHPAAPIFVALILDIAVWLAAYGIEIMGTRVAAKETWETVIILSVAWLPSLWLVFAIQYSGQEPWLTRRNLALLLLPSIVTSILTLTNSAHHLVWTRILIDESGPFLATVPTRGPWFWVHSVFTYGYVLFGIGLFVVFFSRSPRLFRRQGLILVASSLMPLAGNFVHVVGLVPVPGLDPGAFSFALSAGLIAVGMFRYRMLDVVPVAQRVVLDHLHDGVIVLDPHDRIVDLNPAARQMLSLGPGELAGKLASAVLKPPELLRQCRAPDRGKADEILVTSGDAQRWIQASLLPLGTEQKRAAGHILIVHDVTAERAAEQLRQDLTHVTVHDLRNPLNVVYASLGFLADAPQGAIDPPLRPYLLLAERGCRRVMDLVSSILDVSQLESGKMPLHRQPVQVSELIAEVAQGMHLLATEGHLTLAVEARGDLPPVWGDPALLRRVIENLVGNAVKFTPPGGTVNVTARPEEDGLHLVVSDTGPGIPPEVQGRLFQKFCTGSSEKRGSGLGLAFCRLAVEAHGGRVWLESAAGRGTDAHVLLPVEKAHHRGTESTESLS